jgi:hypothetical protein
MIALAEVAHTNGRQSLLWESMSVIAFCKWSTESKAPRRIRRRVMAEKKPSTALSQEADVDARGRDGSVATTPLCRSGTAGVVDSRQVQCHPQ